MKHQNPKQATSYQSTYPTSPWTEVYQSAPCSGVAPQQAGAQAATGYHYDCDDDMQQPTHDALSESYN